MQITRTVSASRSGGGFSPALLIGALMGWAAPVSLIVVRLTAEDLPRRVPVHWSGAGIPDGWGSSSVAFWSLLAPGLVGAFICTGLAIVLASDATRLQAAAAIGAVSAVTGGIAATWFTMLLSASGTSGVILPVLAAIVWSGLIFTVCLLRRNRPQNQP